MDKYQLKNVVALAIRTVAKEGKYVSASSSKTYNNIFSTAHHVKSYLHTYEDIKLDMSDKETTAVREIIDFVLSLTPSKTNRTGEEYYARLKRVYSQDEVKYEEVGMVVSALSFFNNPKMPSSEYTKLIADSQHFGELKGRDNFFVKLLKDTYLHQQECYVYKFITREGNLGFFFKGEKLDIESGDCFLFKGTPIEHGIDRFDKVPITKFNRIAHVENYGRSRIE